MRTSLLLIIAFACSVCHAGNVTDAAWDAALANADKVPVVIVHTAPWCGQCGPYARRLVREGIPIVEVEKDRPLFRFVPYTQVRCRVNGEWHGRDFVGAYSTATIAAEVNTEKAYIEWRKSHE